jgi:hypothetical protein
MSVLLSLGEFQCASEMMPAPSDFQASDTEDVFLRTARVGRLRFSSSETDGPATDCHKVRAGGSKITAVLVGQLFQAFLGDVILGPAARVKNIEAGNAIPGCKARCFASSIMTALLCSGACILRRPPAVRIAGNVSWKPPWISQMV